MPLSIHAQPPKSDGQNDHQKVWAELNLTSDQKAKLKDLHAGMQQTRKEYFDKVKALRQKSKDELLKDKPSSSLLYGYAKELSDLDRVFAEKRVDHLLKVKQILNTDQFSKLVNKEWSGERRMHDDNGDGDRGGDHGAK